MKLSTRPGWRLLLSASAFAFTSGCVDLLESAPDAVGEDGSTVSRSIDGYWLATEQEADGTLDEAHVLEFWYIQVVAIDGDTVHFEVLDACNQEEVLGTGSVTSDGLIRATDEGEHVDFVAEFTGDHEFEFDWTDDHRIVAQRIDPPECSPHPDGTRAHVHIQPIQHVTGALPAATLTQAKLQVQSQVSDEDPCVDVCGDNPDSGRCHLCQADGSLLPVGEKGHTPDPGEAETTCEDANGDDVDCPETKTEEHAGYVQCDSSIVTETNVKDLTNAIMLSDQTKLYPGALVEGEAFSAGGLTPITIPRASGTLTVVGITTQDSQQGTAESTSCTVDEVTLAKVSDAISTILDSVDGTSGFVAFDSKQYFSERHFAADAGLDIGFMDDAFKAGFESKAVHDKTTNIIVTTFYQSYYTVSFAAPQLPWSVFQHGEDFTDPGFQIAEGNPPLYVSDVTYGRQILFFVHSSYGEDLVSAAMRGAYSGEADATISGHAGLKYSDVLKESEITYVSRGASGASAVTPIGHANDPEGFYQAVLDFMADAQAATYSSSNPAVPIRYSLRYLGYPRSHGNANRPAMSAFSATYNELACHTIPSTEYVIKVKMRNFKHEVSLEIGGEVIVDFHKGAGNQTVILNDHIDFGNKQAPFNLTLKLGRRLCTGSAHVEWEILRDGARVWRKTVDRGARWDNALPWAGGELFIYHCLNPAAEAKFSMNLNTGKVLPTEFTTDRLGG